MKSDCHLLMSIEADAGTDEQENGRRFLMSTGNKSFISQSPPEVELLLCSARTEVCAERAARINALLQQPLDWEYLLDMAFRHALAPLLYRQLNRAASKAVPEPHLARLREEFARNTVRNILLTRELGVILELFDGQGIPVIPYKGPALAVEAYGDTALRQFSDLDLLVRERDAVRATQTLLANGYRSHYQTSRKPLANYVRLMGEQGFVRDGDGVYVEVHWNIAPKYISSFLDTEAYWSRAVRVTIAGRTALALSVEDLLLALCVHGGKHQWERLAWVCDLNEMINKHPSIKWKELIAESQRTKTRRMLYLGLYLASELLGAKLPEEVTEQMRAEPSLKSLGGEVRRRFFVRDHQPYSPAEAMRFQFKVRERRLDALRGCYYVTIPPTPSDLTSIRLPNALSFLYYLLRPLRLIKKYTLDPVEKT
jgi:hypothetical protein